jgi:hypothetical protein
MICRSIVNPQICDGKVAKTNLNPSTPTSLSQIEVAVDIRCERYSTAQTMVSMDGQLPVGDKLHRSSLDSDLERAMKN